MQSLEALTRDARALANGDVVPAAPLTGAESEVARQMQICNACRYCEGFCAVFPAMTRRLEFGKADIHFLANLCHNCGACLHACHTRQQNPGKTGAHQGLQSGHHEPLRNGTKP